MHRVEFYKSIISYKLMKDAFKWINLKTEINILLFNLIESVQFLKQKLHQLRKFLKITVERLSFLTNE